MKCMHTYFSIKTETNSNLGCWWCCLHGSDVVVSASLRFVEERSNEDGRI
ncbi:hypothetical protein Hanom_Chr00s000004g01609321 [Helianthus anomalus]